MTNIFYPNRLHEKLSKIKMAIFDVDGVFTDGKMHYMKEGEGIKVFNSLDGHGIKMLKKHNILIAIISGSGSAMLTKRMQDLGVTELYQNIALKIKIYDKLLQKYNIQADEVAYMGDDTPDYLLLNKSGLSICPNNAHNIIKGICDWRLNIQGGNGAVRAVCDAILYAQFGMQALIEEKA